MDKLETISSIFSSHSISPRNWFTTKNCLSPGVESEGYVTKCSDIKYHKETGRVSEMAFEATEY